MTQQPAFDRAGGLREAYERVDWAGTPLGPTSSWSRALRGSLDLVLHTRFPATLFWGPEFVLVYNEAYARLIGDKHPWALGSRTREVFPEAWDAIGPLMEGVLHEGSSTWSEDALVPLRRHGFLEECFFTFSYSPVRGPDGTVEGVIDIAVETTRQVQDRRRLELLARLDAALDDVRGTADVPAAALPLLRSAWVDLPAVDLRLADGSAPYGDPRLAEVPSSAPLGFDAVLEDRPVGRVARVPLGHVGASGDTATLLVLLNEGIPADERYLELLRLLGTTLTRALDRLRAREAEQRTAAARRELSEALQRSLLTVPLQAPDLQVAVRYLPAAAETSIGGDWYDSFRLPDGTLTLVIGDVAGHDRRAAAEMAQVRNVLRGVAIASGEGPAAVLAGLDRALDVLAQDVLATAVVARVEDDGEGGRRLRWSNAGHPPPVLLAPDGRVQLLEGRPDLLLGVEPGAARSEHVRELPAGAGVVLYTDGLVERRSAPLEQGLQWLLDTLEDRQELCAQELCEHLLSGIEGPEDDAAILVMKASGGARG